LKSLSDEWWGYIEHAVREGGRIGVDIGLFNCPGWSQSGGPWIKPGQAMRYVALHEIRVTGGKQFDGKLPQPNGDFQDLAVLAFPAPAHDADDAAARGAKVWAVEKNPDAFRWLSENIKLNHVGDHCHLLQGDALDTALLPHTAFDRLIIPAPYGMDHALEVLLPCLSHGGMVHFYTFKKKEQVPGLVAAFGEEGLDVVYYASCGNVAPGVSRWVFDMVRQSPR